MYFVPGAKYSEDDHEASTARFAVGRSGCVNYPVRSDLERLHLEFLRLEDDGRFAIWSDSVHTRGRTCGGIDVSRIVGSNGPDIRGRRGIERLERGRQFQSARTA